MGSFFYYGKKDDLLQYEMVLPSRYEKMNLKDSVHTINETSIDDSQKRRGRISLSIMVKL
ncbi:MAG TPA: hypothetical protein VFR94_13455 [Nitrososphaeraceae archaeon]|nr:hypothetical protein [Nitrososphaeraceae archaeon]